MIAYVSPHLDDVALSCSARILSDSISNSSSSVLINIFTAANDIHSSYYERRHSEDQAACQKLGLRAFHCGLLDAPYRSPKFDSFGRILWGDVESESSTLQDVKSAISRVLEPYKVEELRAPLGIGWHIDHLVVYEACRQWGNERGVPVSYYEDRPYALIAGATYLRLWELEIQPRPESDIESFKAALMAAPWFSTFREYPQEKYVLNQRIHHWWNKLNDETLSIDKGWQASLFSVRPPQQVWEVLTSYTSQLPSLYGNRDHFLFQSQSYPDEEGPPEHYRERWWSKENPIQVRDKTSRIINLD